MLKQKLRLLRAIKAHIDSLGLKWKMVPDTGSLILLKEGGDNNHYMLITVIGTNPQWEYAMRHFSFARLRAESINQVKKSINNYLNPQKQ
jgi:hypothetical protein